MLPILKRSWQKQTSFLSASKRCLSIHEYQAQHLLAEHDVPVPKGKIACSPVEVKAILEDFGGRGVVKAQVLAGGRGKGIFQNGFQSGVHVVSS